MMGLGRRVPGPAGRQGRREWRTSGASAVPDRFHLFLPSYPSESRYRPWAPLSCACPCGHSPTGSGPTSPAPARPCRDTRRRPGRVRNIRAARAPGPVSPPPPLRRAYPCSRPASDLNRRHIFGRPPSPAPVTPPDPERDCRAGERAAVPARRGRGPGAGAGRGAAATVVREVLSPHCESLGGPRGPRADALVGPLDLAPATAPESL